MPRVNFLFTLGKVYCGHLFFFQHMRTLYYMAVVLHCEGVSKTYHDGNNKTQVLNNVSLSVEQGERVAIVGSSGSGKSTLLHVLGALDQPDTGSVVINGENITQMSNRQLAKLRNQKLGFVYQFHHLLGEFSALENVAMPLLIAGQARRSALQEAERLLGLVGLADRAAHLPNELSGGERQRVAIARALVGKPEVVLADEPTGNLDDQTGKQIFQLLTELSRSVGTSFVIVTHDMTLAEQMDRVVHLSNGQLV